jgi:hypothetical protein
MLVIAIRMVPLDQVWPRSSAVVCSVYEPPTYPTIFLGSALTFSRKPCA